MADLNEQIKEAVSRLAFLEAANRQKRLEMQLVQQEVVVSQKQSEKVNRQQERTHNEITRTQFKIDEQSLGYAKLQSDLVLEVQALQKQDQVLQDLKRRTIEENQAIIDAKQIVETLCSEKATQQLEIKQLLAQKQQLAEERDKLLNQSIQLKTTEENLIYQTQVAQAKVKTVLQ